MVRMECLAEHKISQCHRGDQHHFTMTQGLNSSGIRQFKWRENRKVWITIISSKKNRTKSEKNQHQGVLYGLWVQLLRDRLLSNGNHATSHTANVNCLLSVSVFLEFQTFGMNLNWYNQSSHIIWAQITVIILVIRYYENVRFAQSDPFLPIFLKFSLHFPKCFQKLLHRISLYFE